MLCGVSALLSCVIVWEEVTLAITGQDFSVFSLLVKEVHLRGILSQVLHKEYTKKEKKEKKRRKS